MTTFKKVTAIVRTDMLVRVENRLQRLGVPGITVTRVKGFGEYKNFATSDWMSAYARIDIFTGARQTRALVDAILAEAYSGAAGDGIVVVTPVDAVYRIRDGK
jgi:nitrogen regulatory protein P-II 1